MTGMLITVLLICMSHLIYSKSNLEPGDSHDDIVECVFAIKINDSICIRKQDHGSIRSIFSRQIVQNIGKTPVQVTTKFSNVTVKPCYKKTFYTSMNISNLQARRHRAIVYVSDCNKNSKVYIEEPEEGYDKNKVLWGTATLGVKHIPQDRNLGTLISTFWPEKKKNVWQEIYAVIKDLLDVETQQIISEILNKDIKDIKDEMVALNKMTEHSMYNPHFIEKYMEICEKLKHFETRFKLVDQEIFSLYIIPLYTNVVTMKMYFYALSLGLNGYAPESSEMSKTICETVRYQLLNSFQYLYSTSDKAFYKIYQSGYAGGLYNVIMNARSHFAWHAYELIPTWCEVYVICSVRSYVNFNDSYVLPISFSNLYGRATPNLLTEGIHNYKRPFFEDRFSIILLKFYTIQTKQVKTVYGLELVTQRFSSSLEHVNTTTVSMGNIESTLTHKIGIDSLDLKNKRIIKLNVYKTRYIRCLEFILSDNSINTYGDHCNDNSASSEFFLEDHYIYYFYLKNDYPKTGKYFDNVAVEFLPIGIK